MIVFSWDDLKRLFIAKRKKIICCGFFCSLLTLLATLLFPLQYEARATFKQSSSRTDKSFDLKNLIQTFSTGDAEGSAIAILLSDTVLEKVVQKLNLQVHIKSESPSIRRNILAELRFLKDTKAPSYFTFVNYKGETPIALHLRPLSATQFELLDSNKQFLKQGVIGELLSIDNFQLLLKKMPTAKELTFTLQPISSAIDCLRKKITIKTAREDKNLLLIKCRDTHRKRSAKIANTLMDMYENYLIEENKIIMGAQLSYLKTRQDELSVKLDQDIRNHAETLKSNLAREGFLGIKDEMEFVLEPLQSHQQRLDAIDLELRQINQHLEKANPKNIDKPQLVKRYSQLLAEQVNAAREMSSSLLSRHESMQNGQLLIEAIENDLTEISLTSAKSLFDHYSRQFDELHAQLKQIVFMHDHLFDPHFEISTLSNILFDPVSQQMVQKSSDLEAQLFDDLNQSVKDRSRLESALSVHKRFLKSHLEQTLQLGKIRSELIKEKLSSLYTVIKNLLTQEKEALQEKISYLKQSMQTLPDLWAYENRLKFRAELTKAMMEGLVNIAETKSLSHHLYQVESRPLDRAKPPVSFIAPRLLAKSGLAFVLGSLLFAFQLASRSLLKGIDPSLTTLKQLGAHTSGSLSPKSPLTIDSLEESDQETLRKITAFLLPEKGIVASIGERQTNFLPALTALLQKHQKSSCVIDCSFGKIASGEAGLIQALQDTPPILQHYPSYDFLPTGGSSSEAVELLTSKAFQSLIHDLATQYDYLFLVSRTSSDALESEALLHQSHSAIITLEKLSSLKEDKPVTYIQYPVLVEV